MHRSAVAALCLASLAGCVTTYRPPAEGEPAALVKIKIGYDHAQARRVIPANAQGPHLALSVQAAVEQKTYVVGGKVWPDAFQGLEPAVLDTIPVRLHPGKPVVLLVRLASKWTTSEMRTVQETQMVPKQVTRTESSYNSMTKRTEFRTVTRTEYQSESRTVTKLVTIPHEAGCTARVLVQPVKDGVYLVDYSNLALTADCTAVLFRQRVHEDGTFELAPEGDVSAPAPAP